MKVLGHMLSAFPIMENGSQEYTETLVLKGIRKEDLLPDNDK